MQSPSFPWTALSANVGIGVLTDGWNLAELPPEPGEARTFTLEVTFAAVFTAIPIVQVGLSGFDVDQRDSPRITIKAEAITPAGFQAVISTWATTRVYSVEFNWLAIGA